MSEGERKWLSLLIGLLIGVSACLVAERLCSEGLHVDSVAQSINVILTLVIVILAFLAIRTHIWLHEQTNRPVILCDFVSLHDVLYFRVKNFGSVPGSNIKIGWANPEGNCSFDPRALLVVKDEISLSLLTPSAELLYLCQGPGNRLSGTWCCDLRYSDPGGRKFFENAVLDVRDFSNVDIGRDKNAPVARKLEQIAKALEKRG